MAAQAAMRERAGEHQGQESFERLGASELYCPNCKRSMPVREKPLLHLPNGQLHDYLCAQCGESLGTRQD